MSDYLPSDDPTTPRVLLFGHRGAGKSALIGALLQAGETQGELLRGEVVHSSVDLPRIRDAVYGGEKIEPSQRELVSYTIRLRPWRADGKPLSEPLTVILDDCDGKAAESLLEHPESLSRHQLDTPVARAVAQTDALLLLVDAASTNEELTEAFTEFSTFIEVVERAKTEAREVGGFPIFLVLTQCDRLARPGDTLQAWEGRVKQRSEEAWKAFDAFLKEAPAHEEQEAEHAQFLPFGSIDLNVMAVAIRRPPLAGVSTIHNEPYGVADLFRKCFAEAKAHRERVLASDTRLKWTVRFAFGALAALLTTLAIIGLFPPESTAPALGEKVRDYEIHEPTAAVRLAADRIERNKKTLQNFKNDRDFPELDADLRGFVESRLKEIDDYQAYRKRLEAMPPPASARNVPELKRIQHTLAQELAPPPQYAWEETTAAELRNKWLADCGAIEMAEKEFVNNYRQFDGEGTARMVTRLFDADWLKGIESLVKQTEQPPFPLTKVIPGSYAVAQPGGEAVTYSVPYEFDEVYSARRYWEQTRDRLLHLRDLADALGATTAPNRPPANRPSAVLELPADGGDPVTLAETRWAALRREYPGYSENYSEWELWNFPDPTRTELAARVKRNFDIGVADVRKLMKVRDTKEGWQALAATLSEPTYREWGRLLHLYARLLDPAAPNPVTELESFLRDLATKAFELTLRGFELTIPLDFTVGLDRLEPAGPLTVTVSHGQKAQVAKFAVGKGETRGKSTAYVLTPDGNNKLQYFAGDELRAELPARAGAQRLKLVWDQGASRTFRFDRLSQEPRLEKPTGASEAAPGVRLTPTPESEIPKLPVLMPSK